MKKNPYVGPRPYERADRNYFFGREQEARELLALILSERVALFYAQSGAGKTSLLNASIIPAVEEQGDFYVLPVARVGHELPPGLDPAAVDNVFVFSALLSLAGETVLPQELLEHSLPSFLPSCCPQAAEDTPPALLLILDQFEELFTSHRDRWQEARGFFLQLRQALDELPQLGLLISMREDYVAELDPFAPLLPRRLRARFRMERLGQEGALTAITRPAAQVGLPFAPGVAERLVDDLRRLKVQRRSAAAAETVLGPFVEPVQLQVVCRQLWENLPEQQDARIQWEEVERYGDVDRALSDFYQSTLQQTLQQTGLSEGTLRRWFSQQLITPGGLRGLVLRGPEETAGLPNAAVDILSRRHLIHAETRAGARWYELAHDRLIDPIQKANQAWEKARETPLRKTAQQWQQTGDNSLLYRDSALAEAERWARENAPEVTPAESAFLETSRQAQEERAHRSRRLRTAVTVGLVIGLVVLAVLTALALSGQREARESEAAARTQAAVARTAQAQAEDEADARGTAQAQVELEAIARSTAQAAAEQEANARVTAQAETEELYAAEQGRLTALELARQAQSAFDQSYDGLLRAILLASESISLSHTIEGYQALYDSLRLLPSESAQMEQDGPIQALHLSPDGRWLAAISGRAPGGPGQMRLWQVATGKEWLRIELAQLPAQETGTGAFAAPDALGQAFSPQARFLALADGSTVRLWNIETGREVTTFQLAGPVQTLAFSPDGQWLAAAGGGIQGGLLLVWEVARQESVAQFRQSGAFQGVLFSPNGQWLAARALSADGARSTVQVWSSKGWQEQTAARVESNLPVNALAFSPDGRWLALGAGIEDKPGRVRVWEAASGELLGETTTAGAIDRLVFVEAPATRSDKGGQSLLTLDTSHGQIHLRRTPPEGSGALPVGEVPPWEERLLDYVDPASYQRAGFSPSGRWIVWLSTEGTLKIIESATGQTMALLQAAAGPHNAPAFGPERDSLALGSETGAIQVWDFLAEQEADPKGLEAGVLQASSPDGRYEVVTEADIVLVIDTSTRKVLTRLVHNASISTLAFSPDGQWLVTGTKEDDVGSAWVWEVASGRHLAQIDRAHEVRAVQFSDDGHWLTLWSGQEGDPAWRWLWQPADLLAEACMRLPRNLTDEEWQQYLPEETYRPTCPNLPLGPE